MYIVFKKRDVLLNIYILNICSKTIYYDKNINNNFINLKYIQNISIINEIY